MTDKVIPLEELGKRGTVKVYNQAYVDELEKENAELRRDKEDLIFIRNQKAKCMCEDKERLTKAKELIKRLMDIINHDLKCFDTMAGLDIKQKAEQFLKETKDIREDSTLDGDWVVDEH